MTTAWRRVWINPVCRRGGRRTYQVCYWNLGAGRRRVARSFPARQLAEEFAHRFSLWLNGAGPEPEFCGTPRAPVVTAVRLSAARPWQQVIDEWVPKGSRRGSTIHEYRGQLSHFAKLTGTNTPDEVTEERLEAFLVGLRDAGRKPATLSAHLRLLAQFFRQVRPTDNPVTPGLLARWRPYKIHKRARPHIYSDDEFGKIMAACETVGQPRIARKGRGAGHPGRGRRSIERTPVWWKTFLTVLNDCGLRLNEAVHLTWADLDFAEATLKIRPHLGLPGVFDWRPKGQQHRILALTSRMANLLVALQQEQPAGIPYVFLSAERYRHLRRAGGSANGLDLTYGIHKRFVALRRQAGIGEGCLHDWRRTAITRWCLMPGLTAKEVQILAGHENIQTTLDIYAEVKAGDVVSKLKGLLEVRERTEPDLSHTFVGLTDTGSR